LRGRASESARSSVPSRPEGLKPYGRTPVAAYASTNHPTSSRPPGPALPDKPNPRIRVRTGRLGEHRLRCSLYQMDQRPGQPVAVIGAEKRQEDPRVLRTERAPDRGEQFFAHTQI